MKVKDGIIGFIVGDALGVPVEFNTREELAENPVTEMRGYGTYKQPKGTWSDDSAMTLATMNSIVKKQGIDYTDMMDKFTDWLENGKYMQDGYTFDCGNTTSTAIRRYEFKGILPLECGGTDEHDNGNGSLMRILPLAYIKDMDYETIENMSALTHGHERSKIACVLYVEMAKSMLKNDLTIEEHIKLACDRIKEHYKGSSELKEFQRIFDNDLDDVNGKGYVINTFECVVHCLLTTDSYSEAVLKAVNIGDDTDTTAAICGGLAGIYYGYESIPVDWTKEIRCLDKVESLCERYEAFCDES